MNWKFYPVEDFTLHCDSWDKLNNQGAATPLLSSNFISPILNYFSNSQDKLAIYKDDQKTLAMTILSKKKLGVWETLQPSQSPLGLWIQSPFLSTSSALTDLRKALPFPTLLLGVTQQDPDILPRPEKDKGISTLDYIQTARVTINKSFDDYWSQRGKNLRQNLKRQRNRLEREGVNTRLVAITEHDQIKLAIEKYGELESAGWKNAGGTAIHINNEQGKFYLDMLTNFCCTQDTLIYQYYYDSRLVATDLCIKAPKSLIILKTTYDESITTSSPAMLMRQEAFEHIFNNHLAEKIEFYGKVMDWHTKWSDEIRTMYHINCNILGF